jgi:hypothetical protein
VSSKIQVVRDVTRVVYQKFIDISEKPAVSDVFRVEKEFTCLEDGGSKFLAVVNFYQS